MSAGLMASFVLASAMLTESYAVGGVHLGDSPATARAELLALGYSITVQYSASYQQRLLAAKAEGSGRQPAVTKPTGIGSYQAVNGSQRVTVRFDDNASGQRVVSRVRYTAPELAHPYDAALRTLVARNGTPTKVRPYGVVWCGAVPGSEGEENGCDVGVPALGDSLTIRQQGGFSPTIVLVELETGTKTLKVWAAAHEADLRRLARERDTL